MLKNYFKIAYRNLLKSKGFSFINLTGLSIGISACILISVYIIHETSYDKFVPNSANIYRLVAQYNFGPKTEKDVHFSANMARTLESDYGEIEEAGRIMANDLFYGAGTNEIQIDDQEMQHHEEKFAYADQAILDIFSVPLVFGDSKTALEEPKTMVISESVSRKFFKDQNPIGHVIYLNGNREDPRRITGVMQDFPTNSHLDYSYFLTMSGVEFGQGEQERWIQSNYQTYISLRPDTDVSLFDQTFGATIIKKYLKPALAAAGYAMAEEIEDKASIYLQPMTDIQLYSSDIGHESGFRNDIKVVWIFGTVAVFILLLATINFVNLSTARSANRAKEVGLRKVVGSGRSNLILQFLTESLLLTLIAFAIGLVLAQSLMPVFQEMTGIELSMPWENGFFVPVLLLSAVLVGCLAGFYPALYLSGFSPINVLKGKLRLGGKSGGFRSGLVVLQFTISIVLIIGTLIINEQMSFILNSKVGFEKDQVIQLYGTNMLGDKDVTFKEELAQLQEVESVTISDYLPLENTKRNGNQFTNEGRENIDESISGQVWQIDEGYVETLGIELIAGRNFDAAIVSDQNATIVNEQMVKELGLTDPIGKKISRSGQLNEIVGVVKNFRFDNMKQRVMPLAMFFGKSNTITSVKVNTADMPGLLKTIENKWNEFAPNLSFRYAFMDDSFAQMYDNVYRIKTIFTSFAVLAILVACMGLFALSAFMVEQRNKEMSIRKVLGASIQGIFRMQTQNFISLILISLILAIPIAYYLMEDWLKDYEYKIEIGWQTFLVSGVMAVTIALLTISYHAIKSAMINPVNNLKGE
ncbi:ABC transporter permease [Algoriphagus sp. D3-2-R+10]|uniref:ABC transporter permease n=1 Tax=Algoriphagus aurantiacus TaxID=3103948 RepID=UPI002B3CCE37|nr:ABC transporter permease [Algoriphagus sp. D3-2-R+10]MEB2775055.1 ABC transporter permease [Algoriphagus sp. D3-2-R+10]